MKYDRVSKTLEAVMYRKSFIQSSWVGLENRVTRERLANHVEYLGGTEAKMMSYDEV